MKNKSKQKVTLVEESDYGLYLWETDDGKLICDEDSNYLNIPAKKGDRERVRLLELAALWAVSDIDPAIVAAALLNAC